MTVVARVQDIRKSFGEHRVLNGISADFMEHRCTFVAGPSGTGKSVLVKHLVGLLRPDSGSAWYRDQRVDELSERELFELRRRCVYVFQHPTLFDSMSVLENVSLVVRHHFGVRKREADGMAMAQLEELGMSERARHQPGELSAGEQKMISLARALALKPETLILDEPTTGLDPYAARELDRLVDGFSGKGMSLIIISHDLGSIRRLADDVLFLVAGKVRLAVPSEQFFSSRDPAAYQFVNGLVEGVL